MQTETVYQSTDPVGSRPGMFASVYGDLKRIAARHMRSERQGHTMQITALVHEAYLRMARRVETPEWKDHLHFLAFASQSMRHILVDHARARMAKKRDMGSEEGPFHGFTDPQQFVDLHEALSRLAVLDPRQAQIVELRFFGGLTEEEIAGALGVSLRTVKREWMLAKAWLYGELIQ